MTRTHCARADGVVGQVASTTVLLISAGLLICSFVTLVNVNPGYDPREPSCFVALALRLECHAEPLVEIAQDLC